MAYVHLKESKMGAGIAKIIGKLQGKLSANAINQTIDIANSLRLGGCPTGPKLNRLQNQAAGISNALGGIERRISKFKRIPKKLKPPIKGLKTIIKIITSLPIPQSVPPGFGLPLLITTKYSDLLVKIREFVVQIEEIINVIENVLDAPSTTLNATLDIVHRADNAITSCVISKQIEDELNNGNISEDLLSEAGLLDDDGILIFSTLGPTFIGNGTLTEDGIKNPKKLCTQEQIDSGDTSNCLIGGTGSGTDGRFREEDFDTDNPSAALAALSDGLNKLQDSNIGDDTKKTIEKLLNTINDSKQDENGEDLDYNYLAENGIKYILEIQKDPNSPAIAPKRFAVAKTIDEGVTVLKGQSSFSSDVNVLLDEVKFRLDNQLP